MDRSNLASVFFFSSFVRFAIKLSLAFDNCYFGFSGFTIVCSYIGTQFLFFKYNDFCFLIWKKRNLSNS